MKKPKWKDVGGGRHELSLGRYLAFVEERDLGIPKWTLCVGGLAFFDGSASSVLGAKRKALAELSRRGLVIA